MRAAIVVLLACVFAQTIPPPDPARGLLTGHLTYSDTGAPAGQIHLRLIDRSRGEIGGNNTPPDGRVSNLLRPGVYRFVVDLPADQTRYLSGPLGAEGTLEEGDLFRVRAGSERVFNYALKLSGALGGHVLDSDGKPLRYAVVSVDADPADNGGLQIVTRGSAATDADGHFMLSGLAPGLYRVRVDPPEKQRPDADGRVLLPTYYPDRRRLSEAMTVPVGIGEQFDGLHISMIRGAVRAVTGKVLDVDGSPAVNRSVIVMRSQASPGGLDVDARRSRELSFSATALTDSEGRFTIERLLPGHYDVVAHGPGFRDDWGSADIDMDSEDVRNVTVQILPVTVLRGQVVFEEREHPAPTIRVRPMALQTVPSAAFAVVNHDGTFDLLLNAARVIQVELIPARWHLKAILINGRNVVNETVDAQYARSPVTIVLGKRMAALVGRVEHPAETDVVLAIADDSSKWTSGSSQLAIANLDDRGEFRFDNLLAGEYRVTVVPRIPFGFRTGDRTVIGGLSAAGVPVRVADDQERRILLTSRTNASALK